MNAHAPQKQTQWAYVVELIGEAAADRLSRDFGGRRVFVPKSLGEHHPLAASIGLEAARTLVANIGPGDLEPPLSQGRRLRIVELLKAGWKAERIGPAVGCSRRTVFRVKAALAEADDQQQGLPF